MNIVNHSQLEATRQLPGTAVGAAREVALIPWEVIDKCANGLDAIRVCVQMSGYSNEEIARRLGIHKTAFSRMMSGRASFPDAKRIDLMSVCGNCAPVQYDVLKLGLVIAPDRRKEGYVRTDKRSRGRQERAA